MRQLTYCQAINEALREALLRDPSVFIMGEDIGSYGGTFGVTAGLFEEFGADRVIDTPISEAAMAAIAITAAVTGLRPVLEIMFIDFLLVAADGVFNQAGKMRYMSGWGLA